MEYQVPQFIEVEGKIVGPLTLKQFIYIAGAGGLCVIFFSYLPIVFALILSGIVVGSAAALSFYKINNKPLVNMLEAGFNYYVGSKLFLWKHAEPTEKKKTADAAATAAAEAAAIAQRRTPKLTRGKLAELAWSLDVKGPGPDSSSYQ